MSPLPTGVAAAGLDPADFVLAGNDAAAFLQLAAQSQTLLQFQAHTVLSSHDLSTVDGRMRAFAVLRGILAQAASPLERDEEVRYVADRLQLSEDNVRFLLTHAEATAGERRAALMSGAADSRARPRPQARRTPEERVLMGTHELEARFLAACLALPDPGRDYLLAIDEGFFSSEPSRQAYRAVVARLGSEHAGKKSDGLGKVRADESSDDSTMAEVVVRAAAGSFSPIVLKELFLRVQQANVTRLIAKLKASVAADDSGRDEGRLIELEGMRRDLRNELRNLPVDE